MEHPHKQAANLKLADYFKFLIPQTSNAKDIDYKTQAGRQIKILENLIPKPHDQAHIKKVCQLLKKKDKNYSKKRMNISKTTYSFDENNNLYLTLPKFDYGKRIRDIINEKRLAEDKLAESVSAVNLKTKLEIEAKKSHLEDLIPEFFENNENVTEESQDENYKLYESESSVDTQLNEFEKKLLFDKLRTKENFNKNKDESTNKSSVTARHIRDRFKLNALHWGKKSFEKDIKSYSPSPNGKFITAIDYVNKREQSFVDINPEPLIDNIKKLTKKIKIIETQRNKNKKPKIHPVDLFYYDKHKWQKHNMKDSDRILKNIRDFESRRNEIFSKMASPIKASTSRKIKLSSLNLNYLNSDGENNIFSSKDLNKALHLPKVKVVSVGKSLTSLNLKVF